MDKKNYLTKEEQILFSTLRHTTVIDHAFIQELFPTYASQKINKLCHQLLSKGYLYPLKRGSYLVNDTPSDKPLIQNPFQIAPYVQKGYIGFSSALRLYNLITYEPFTIFIVTPHTSQEKTLGDYVFKSVAMGKKATGATFSQGVYVSTREKTLFDCMYKPQYAGGYKEIIHVLESVQQLQWDHLLNYFTRFASHALFQRSGYIFQIAKEHNLIHPPSTFLRHFQQHIRNTTKLVPSKPSKGVYIHQWKLLDNIGVQTLLSEA